MKGVTVDIVSPVTLTRSSVATYCIRVATEGESALYLGAAYTEAIPDPPDADYVFCGGYGPLYKEGFSLDGRVYLCDAAAEYYNGDASVYKKTVSVILNND
jgi:hypothetical protein